MGAMSNLDILLKELDSKMSEVHELVSDIHNMLTSDDEPLKDDWEDFKREEQLRDAREEENEAAKVEKKVLTITDVRPVLAELSRNGHTAEVKELLTKYGANKLSEIKPNDYEALLNDAKVLENGC